MRESSAALLRLRCAITSALRGAGLIEPARSRSGEAVHRQTELGARRRHRLRWDSGNTAGHFGRP